MEPIFTTLLGAGKLLGDLAKSLKGNEKEKLEFLVMQVNWAKDMVAALAAENDKLKSENANLIKENKELQERIAFHDVSDEYEAGTYSGLLHKKTDGDGPYCPKDRVRMVRIKNRDYKCPICQLTGVW